MHFLEIANNLYFFLGGRDSAQNNGNYQMKGITLYFTLFLYSL